MVDEILSVDSSILSSPRSLFTHCRWKKPDCCCCYMVLHKSHLLSLYSSFMFARAKTAATLVVLLLLLNRTVTVLPDCTVALSISHTLPLFAISHVPSSARNAVYRRRTLIIEQFILFATRQPNRRMCNWCTAAAVALAYICFFIFNCWYSPSAIVACISIK